ncbi:MAG: phenylalanine--tRNA ligase subunit beta [Chitinophagaceae bacterium]
MTISYKWLSEYLPVSIEPEPLSQVLTSIGLEVESMNKYESVRGGLKGLIIGEVVLCEKHPYADKLMLTRVDIGEEEPLQIVCGAPNVALGQKVVVAPVGTTIYPANGQEITMKLAKIRNVDSYGMICAEDELGIGEDHAGIIILPSNCTAGEPAATFFQPYEDIIFEIGLTPNRMDAMSHLGVARDVCAYLTHHYQMEATALSPFGPMVYTEDMGLPVIVSVENLQACQRYSGLFINGITIGSSPLWLQHKLKAIGLRPINNIVDITNYVLHETGQPLHAFEADAVKGDMIIVKNLKEGTRFKTLDEKERTLSSDDLMICNAEEPMCFGGVFGGFESGVKNSTTRIFLESAWFNPADIRKTSLRHNLRTDAATRFEKGVDISNTVNVLKRAALMIRDITGGEIASGIVDIFPAAKVKTEVALSYHYLKKISGKFYHPDVIRKILEALSFEVIWETADEIRVRVPYHKPDISLPADIVEEILRIDGYDNIMIPSVITITPALENKTKANYKEKVAGYLTGAGFNEIMTNSITNSDFFPPEVLTTTVRMLNSLSAELNIMRPSMLETGLQAMAYNLNRRNDDLQFFEFGKTYAKEENKYKEQDHLCLYTTGKSSEDSWRSKGLKADFYYLKGLTGKLIQLLGVSVSNWTFADHPNIDNGLQAFLNGKPVLLLGAVSAKVLQRFDIKQPVFFVDLYWDPLMDAATKRSIQYEELPRQLPVQRDLAIIVPDTLLYGDIERTVNSVKLEKLQGMHLFDIFESEKLGSGKKSMAVSFTFLDKEKTLNDKEIDGMMNKIMASFENELQVEIRR